MEKLLNHIAEDVRTLSTKQDAMNRVLVENTTNLKEHMRRTDILEAELRPVKAHVAFVNLGAKVIAAGVAVLAALKSLHVF